MKNQFHGLSKEHKATALLIYQKALIWMNCIEIKINERSIDPERIRSSYMKGVNEEIIDKNEVPLDEYITQCYHLLALYIKLKRAFILEQQEIIENYGGFATASKMMGKIGDTYHFLIDSFRQEVTDRIEEGVSDNVQHILSAKKGAL